MPIRDLMRYDLPEGFKLEKEDDVLELLRNVRTCINNLEYKFETHKLKKVLNTIEAKKHIIESWASKDTEIDLSSAYEIISEYRRNSEGGCQSCKSIGWFKEREEVFNYCKLSETESDVNKRTGHSPRIEKHFEEGCKDRVLLFRPLEQVLEDY